MPTKEIIAEAFRFYPDAVLFGHSGPTSGHPVIAEVAGDRNGGATRIDRLWRVFPTYHWREILSQESYATAIVRCEGEETVRRLMRALEPRQPIGEVAGVAYRKAGRPCATRPVICDLDAYRIGWELIDHAP